jgi:hypothetical protein
MPDGDARRSSTYRLEAGAADPPRVADVDGQQPMIKEKNKIYA